MQPSAFPGRPPYHLHSPSKGPPTYEMLSSWGLMTRTLLAFCGMHHILCGTVGLACRLTAKQRRAFDRHPIAHLPSAKFPPWYFHICPPKSPKVLISPVAGTILSTLSAWHGRP